MDIPKSAKICGRCRSRQRDPNARWSALVLLAIIVGFPILLISINGDSKPTSEARTAGASSAVASTPKADTSDLVGKAAYNASGITITNSEDKSWDGCTLNLNTKYKPIGLWKLAPHTDGTFPWSDFTTGDGTRFNIYATKPQTLVMTCGQRFGTWGF